MAFARAVRREKLWHDQSTLNLFDLMICTPMFEAGSKAAAEGSSPAAGAKTLQSMPRSNSERGPGGASSRRPVGIVCYHPIAG